MSTRSCSDNGPQCPKCRFTFTPDEEYYYNEAKYTEDECPECGAKFKVEVETTTSWSCTLVEEAET